MSGNWESPTKPWDLCSDKRKAQLTTVWNAGNLRWKLDPSQQVIYDQIYASHGRVKSSADRIFGMDVSRQSGKDFIMATIAIETALRRRKPTRLPYGAPTKDTVHELLVPTFEAIFQDCPPDLLPHEIRKGTFRTNSKELNWPWGARIVLIGVDLHPDWLRGPATYAFFLTEPAFMDNLQDLMEGVLLPQMLTQQEGFAIMGSTPPVTPGHPWSTKYIPAFKARGSYAKRVIDDCPRFSPEQVEAFVRELGGRTSTRVRRELYCEHIIESTLAVVPEFQDVREKIVTTEGFDNVPPFRDTYVALDPGYNHATAGVFAYTDFSTGLCMIEGDFAVSRLNSREVSRYVKAREWQLWGRAPTKPQSMTEEAWKDELKMIKALFYLDLPPLASPVQSWRDGQIKINTFRRVSDTDSRLIADMSSEHGLVISPTEKDDSEAALNSLRVRLQGLKFRIHPRCVSLITHLEQGTWNKGRTKLAESPDGGHFDGIPALVYLNRNIIWGKNPNPPTMHSHHTHFIPNGAGSEATTARVLGRLFGSKTRR
jgi:hypothetical protein